MHTDHIGLKKFLSKGASRAEYLILKLAKKKSYSKYHHQRTKNSNVRMGHRPGITGVRVLVLGKQYTVANTRNK